MRDLYGRVAVVTGAASGIGRSLADGLAAEGMKVVLADIEAPELEKAVGELRQTGAEVIGVRTDVSKPADIDALAVQTIEAFGAVHVVCNNAGVESGALFSDIPVSTWEWVVDVNFWGVLHGCRTFLPLLRQQDEGHIVNTASVAAFETGFPTFTPYTVTKFAVLALTECLEIELRQAGDNVGVSLLAPGTVNTQMPASERNRPPEVLSSDRDPVRRELLKFLEDSAVTDGMEPSEVADQVVEAIREQRFYVLPHPQDAIDAVRARLGWMENDEAPQPPVIPGGPG